MNIELFVEVLAGIKLSGVFNPYSDVCPIFDRPDAPRIRKENLVQFMRHFEINPAETVWVGRDLGYRGGRRTGLPFTDEGSLSKFESVYSSCRPCRATEGEAVAERTAGEIWQKLQRIDLPPFLWNVFPFHPHDPDNPLSNRRFTAKELTVTLDLTNCLFRWLNPKKIIGIGNDAAAMCKKLGYETIQVRHPSYGGLKDFRSGMNKIYSEIGF